MLKRWACKLTLICAVQSTTSLFGAAPVTGEPALLTVLRDAQAAAESGFPKGRFRWKLEDERQGARIESDGLLTWSGDNTRWEYREVQCDASGRRTLARGADGTYQVAIRTPKEFTTYAADLKSAVRVFDRSQSMPHYAEMLPQRAWCGTSVYSGRPWSEMLDPALNEQLLEAVSVRRLDADRVQVTRHHHRGLPDYWFVFSLSSGGNVVEYGHDSDGSDDLFSGCVQRGRMEWKPIGDGRFALVRREHEHKCPRRPEATHKIVLNVFDFDPSPELPESYFTFEGLDVVNGTVVTVRGGSGQRKYVVGSPDSTLDNTALEKLSEKLRSQGFGAADRQ